jgi:hypothetical protein
MLRLNSQLFNSTTRRFVQFYFFTNSPFSPFCFWSAQSALHSIFENGNNAKESAGNLLCPFGGPFESCCFWRPERALKIQHELPFCISEPYYSIHYSVPFQRSRLGHVNMCMCARARGLHSTLMSFVNFQLNRPTSLSIAFYHMRPQGQNVGRI